ncbi:MAG: SPFH domain-containing protein [Candidatus Cloacimonetes bacterium]|nr:SPFH domain-containing protein [Candidatus Cloacimonadota bacterium]
MNKEFIRSSVNGWFMILVELALLGGTIFGAASESPLIIFSTIGLFTILTPGFFILQPNEARVLTLFGTYKGTVRTPGLHWVNPLMFPMAQLNLKVSLRSRNLNGHTLKVNDKKGNPIEISAVVVWRVQDTAKSVFDVDDYCEYVKIQSEAAIRHLASIYPYDHGEAGEKTLRCGMGEVAESLRNELTDRFSQAGIEVVEARLSHLAYAPEIAQAMLRRQQAEAVIAARKVVVEGAVSMVEMALTKLSERGVVDLDEERKASMVSNLLVILCGEKEASPVINTGTLYS